MDDDEGLSSLTAKRNDAFCPPVVAFVIDFVTDFIRIRE
jgi:hypothetical protein